MAAQAELASLRAELERITQERRQVEDTLTAMTASRDQIAGEQRLVERQQIDLQTQLAQATENLAGRNKEIADLEGRLQSARQELADTQARLAGIRQELAAPRAPGNQPAQQDASPVRP